MGTKFVKLFAAVLLGAAASLSPVSARESAPAPVADRFAHWEKEIAGIEAREKDRPAPKGGVLFIGSSSIRMWDSLERDFPGHQVVNHGFGGSQIEDSTHFAARLVFPCAPKVIFLRSGVNDIHAGKTPERVFADYKAFVAAVHAKLPETRIVFLGLCPTIARRSEVPDSFRLNAMVRVFAKDNPLLDYVDCEDMTVGADGEPRPELFQPDGLHLSAEGYRLLAARARPYLPPVPAEK